MPSVLNSSASVPTAVFSLPVVLFKRATVPTAVLSSPIVLNKSDAAPNAVFSSAVLNRSAPRAGSGVEAALCGAKERIPPDCCIRCAGGKVSKGVLPFRRCEIGIASVWRRVYCPRYRQKPKAKHAEEDEN